MDSIKNEIKPRAPEDVTEKKRWITPEIEVLDIVNMTKSSPFSSNKLVDGSTSYS